MVNRNYMRYSLSLNIELRRGTEHIGYFRTRDVGLNGICISATAIGLRVNDPVELKVEFETVGNRGHQIDGMVIHQSTTTVGMTFVKTDPEFLSLLAALFERILVPTFPKREGYQYKRFWGTNDGANQTAPGPCESCPTKLFCVWSAFEPWLQDRLINKVEYIFQRGMDLFREGSPFRTLYVVRSGNVKTWKATSENGENIIRFHSPGDVLGLGAISTGRYDCNATALEVSSVCEIRFDLLLEAAHSIPAVQHHLLRIMSDQIVQQQEIMQLRGNKKSVERLADFLDRVSNNHLARGYSSRSFILTMSRRDIGNYLGITEETVSRMLAQLHNDGTIRVNKRLIHVIDPGRLRRFAGSQNNDVNHMPKGGVLVPHIVQYKKS